jgi:aminoglycoside phosphotransferase (APT) family kinase protein
LNRFLGAPVVRSETQPGGFSPGVAAIVATSQGRKAFVKSSSSLISEPSANANRREIKYTAALQGNPRVPKLLHSFEKNEWVLLVYEVIEGRHPELPWKSDELDLVLSELSKLIASLTPCPHPNLFTPLAESDTENFNGWSLFSQERSTLRKLQDPWIEANLESLVSLEERWPDASRGDALLHTDLRADQILITKDRAVFLDWPHAKIGAAWIDFLFMFPSIVLQKGPGMDTLIERSPLASVPEAKLFPMAVALAGFFLWNSLQPPFPRLPTLREFQRTQGDVVIRWLEKGMT